VYNCSYTLKYPKHKKCIILSTKISTQKKPNAQHVVFKYASNGIQWFKCDQVSVGIKLLKSFALFKEHDQNFSKKTSHFLNKGFKDFRKMKIMKTSGWRFIDGMKAFECRC
jgi:hypothetical protein